jgi:Tfp pilus assembly protein PilO
MKNLPKEKRDRLILVCLGTCAIVAGLYLGLISIQRKNLEAMDKRQKEQQTKLTNGERLVNSLPQIQKDLETAVGRLKAVEATMPSGDMYSWVILTINTFKENYKVDIPQFSREVPADVGMFSKFPYRAAVFTLRGTAHFHDLGRFIADFENTFPYMRIQNIELDPAATSNSNLQNDEEKLTFKLEIVTLVNTVAPAP